MAVAQRTALVAAKLPGPSELFPGRPDAIVDLQTDEGIALVRGTWRYSDADVREIDFVEVGSAADPLGPGDVPNRTFDVVPHAEGAGFDDSGWRVLAPDETMLPLGHGRVGLHWYPIDVFGINGPISASPHNYIWMRSATLDLYAPERAATVEEAELEIEELDERLAEIVPDDVRLERVAGGFEFTEGPVWTQDGALLFSSPNTNAIYRWTPTGSVSVFRSKSGFTGTDIGRYDQPGSNGLTFSPDGALTICQHGNHRVIRVNPHGDTTILADTYEGKRLNSPNDLVYRSDGTL